MLRLPHQPPSFDPCGHKLGQCGQATVMVCEASIVVILGHGVMVYVVVVYMTTITDCIVMVCMASVSCKKLQTTSLRRFCVDGSAHMHFRASLDSCAALSFPWLGQQESCMSA